MEPKKNRKNKKKKLKQKAVQLRRNGPGDNIIVASSL